MLKKAMAGEPIKMGVIGGSSAYMLLLRRLGMDTAGWCTGAEADAQSRGDTGATATHGMLKCRNGGTRRFPMMTTLTRTARLAPEGAITSSMSMLRCAVQSRLNSSRIGGEETDSRADTPQVLPRTPSDSSALHTSTVWLATPSAQY